MRRVTQGMVAAAVLAAAAAAFWWGAKGRREQPVEGPGGAPAATPVQAQRPPATAEPPVPAAPAGPIVLKVPAVSAAPRNLPLLVLTGATCKVRSDAILADVNGTPLRLKDLMTVGSSSVVERAISPQMFGFLLSRAIAREVAFQVAQASGVSLGEEQLRQLETIRQRALERDPASFTDVHDDPAAKAEFDVRDFAGLMTQEALLAAAGGPPKHVTRQRVDEYYQAHAGEFGSLPQEPEAARKAWEAIEVEIRGRLADPVTAAHQKALDEMMSELLARSTVSTFVAPAPAVPPDVPR